MLGLMVILVNTLNIGQMKKQLGCWRTNLDFHLYFQANQGLCRKRWHAAEGELLRVSFWIKIRNVCLDIASGGGHKG